MYRLPHMLLYQSVECQSGICLERPELNVCLKFLSPYNVGGEQTDSSVWSIILAEVNSVYGKGSSGA